MEAVLEKEGNMKWFVVVDYIHGIKCVGINDEDYFVDGEILVPAIVDEAEGAACAYAKSNLPLFEDNASSIPVAV